MVREQNTLQLRAVFLICLLAGAECARVHTRVSLEATVRTDATRAELGQELSVFGSIMSQGQGHDVCRAKDLQSPHGAVDRYKEKAEKVLKLFDKIANKTSKLKDVLELAGRERKFVSCKKLVQASDGETMSPQMRDLSAVMETGNYSIKSVQHKGLSAIVEVAKKHGLFKTKGNCGFDLGKLDLDAAWTSESHPEKMDAIRAQIFGPECTKSAYDNYLSGVTGSEKKIINQVIDLLSSAAQGKDAQQTHKEIEEEALQEISKLSGVDIDSLLDSDLGSLLELGEPVLIGVGVGLLIALVLAIIVSFSPPP